MDISLTPRLSLGSHRPDDKAAYLVHFADQAIYDRTLRIPYPYGESDADFWLNLAAERDRKLGRVVNFAIRENGYLIGGCGFHDWESGSHKSEIGYWLAKPWWGKGIMALAVAELVRMGFEEMGLIRVTATIFDDNSQSQRVLEKCGFVYEGSLLNYYKKDGRIIHARLYARFPA